MRLRSTRREFRIPPVRLYRAGELQKEILEILLLNIRDSQDRKGDIRAHVGCLNLGERRIQELEGRFGTETLRLALSELQNISEVKTRHGICGCLRALTPRWIILMTMPEGEIRSRSKSR